MSEEPFTNRELKLMFDGVHEKLDGIKDDVREVSGKQDYTNGKLKKTILALSIIGTAVLTLLFTNGSELVEFVLKII